MPIYIIFNDKTFIDMSAKAPEAGEAKYDKYRRKVYTSYSHIP